MDASGDFRDPAKGYGPGLRHARRLRRLTMRDVAERAGCSESMVSKIETGRVEPSLNLLRRIVDALDISVAALCGDDEAGGIVQRAGTRPLIRIGRAGPRPAVVFERLMPAAEGFRLEASIHAVSPGGSSAGPTDHVGEEFGYILEGVLDLTVDGEVLRLEKGDSFCFRSEKPHGYRNPGPVTARILWVNTPPTF